jgi:replication factor A2
MVISSQTGAFSPSQFTPSSTTPLTVKQIADAQLAGAGEKGAPFAVDGVETANVCTDSDTLLLLGSLCVRSRDWLLMWIRLPGLQIRLVGTVSGKAERATDVSFTLDDGTGRLDFIRW